MPVLDSFPHNPWVCTWLATSQPTYGEAFPFPVEIPATLCNQTVRQTLRISLGGQKLRFKFSNRYGTQPLTLGESHFVLKAPSGEQWIMPITFDGQCETEIPTGKTIYSDEVIQSVPALSEIELRTYLPELVHLKTFHWDARHYSQLESGNRIREEADKNSLLISSRLLLESVDIQPNVPSQTVVVIGDSMVDGNGVEMGTYARWIDFLAERLISKSAAVVNAGQSGSRLLKDGIGISTLSRFTQDVIDQPCISTCIVQVGLNDLGLAETALAPTDIIPSANMLINGYQQLLKMAHKKGLHVVGVTLVPLRCEEEYGLENFYSSEKEAIRQTVNQWIRSSGEFDALIDSDQLVCDAENSHQLKSIYNSGDHLHLNKAGHRHIAESISLDSILRC
ncbi:GDSL-like Lipase/Acylhydrolase [Providencia rustigianii]|uniref:GDSL-like Lipase/Acylhydrolase n=1 Tax=Providencia rustigianii TaxID=158850 RepID=A0A379G496_9GAMM|nr:SGNH/GDSL hydrolase family protein [Providencia rustigianii]SUC35874.1 GDSL-like Lipase/Acylhydrolase [Providencia rustigianii]